MCFVVNIQSEPQSGVDTEKKVGTGPSKAGGTDQGRPPGDQGSQRAY